MRFAPRAINYSSTGGLSALELLGSRKACDELLSAAGDGGIVYYGIESQNADEWEEGVGIVHAGSPPTLERVAVIESSNADALVNFTAGPKLVFITSPSIVQAAAHLHKAPCRVVVTTNVNLASALAAGSSAGGVTLAAGDRVLLVGQTTASQNGIWIAPTSGAATRPLDFYTGDTCRGSIVSILEGAHSGETYVCTATASAVIGSSSQTWVSAVASFTGSTSITTLGTITTGVWNGTTIAIANGGTGATDAAGARSNLGVTATGSDTTYCYRSNNLSDLASASTARSNLGLGTLATQNANSVSITGGSISGITDLAIADGGTGASDAATARSNLGAIGTGAVTSSGLTMATSKLLGRTSASTGAIEEIAVGSNLTLSTGILAATANVSASLVSTDNGIVLWSGTSGQILKQASGTGIAKVVGGVLSVQSAVAVADGGTGAATSSAAATNLGLGTTDNVTHLTVTASESTTGSGNGGLVATTATAGGNAGIRLASGGTNRFQIGCIGSAGSTSMRFYCYETSAEGFRIDPGRNLAIGTTVAPTGGTSCLILGVAGTVLTPHSSQCGLYGETITATTELRAVDGAGNRVTLTPHPPEVLDSHTERLRAVQLEPVRVPWGYRSENDFLGVETVGDMAAALRCVEWLMLQAGKPISLVIERDLQNGPAMTWAERQENCAAKWEEEARAHDHALARWAAQPFWIRDTVSRRPLSIGPRPDAHEPPQWLEERLTKSKA